MHSCHLIGSLLYLCVMFIIKYLIDNVYYQIYYILYLYVMFTTKYLTSFICVLSLLSIIWHNLFIYLGFFWVIEFSIYILSHGLSKLSLLFKKIISILTLHDQIPVSAFTSCNIDSYSSQISLIVWFLLWVVSGLQWFLFTTAHDHCL